MFYAKGSVVACIFLFAIAFAPLALIVTGFVLAVKKGGK